MEKMTKPSTFPHQLPPLPYGKDALAPLISAETLEFHHDKHHNAYVTKLNELVKGTAHETLTLPQVIERASGALFNNAAQTWNHTFYWHCLCPRRDGRPTGELATAIDRAFGGFDEFAKQFKASASANFGSGWTWLTRGADGKLAIVNTDDADTPLRTGAVPLLTCDVWEHAYYIDYRNRRPDYLDAYWRLVDWAFVARNLAG